MATHLKQYMPTSTFKNNIFQENIYDPEMLYVECRHCSKPILWQAGCTTMILNQTKIDPASLDASCLILSHGCKECMPKARAFELSIVRLADFGADIMDLFHSAGNA